MAWQILQGDCVHMLKTLPGEMVHCCLTSPPYYALRDYGVDGQLGLERTPEELVAKLVGVFREVRRVLRSDGTLWVVAGDSYANTGKSGGGGQGERWKLSGGRTTDCAGTFQYAPPGYKPKDLIGFPWLLAVALRQDGWYLRSEIIWHKPNAMPESVTDRPTKAHESIFLLSKCERYYYDHEAVMESAVSDHPSGNGFKRPERLSYAGRGSDQPWDRIGGKRNRRSVWTIPTKPFLLGAHFATFPEKLVVLCLCAGTSLMGCCGRCGAPRERVVEPGAPDEQGQRAGGANQQGTDQGMAQDDYHASGVQQASVVKARILTGLRPHATVTWRATCFCPEHEVVPCTVLDPFMGSGTTGLVALRLQQNCIGIELNPAYVQLARKRLREALPLFHRETEPGESGIGR